jgi:hypothetical protein
VTEKTTFDVQTYHFVKLILLDSLLIAAMGLLGSLLKWNRESVPLLEQSVRGYIKNFYNKKTADQRLDAEGQLHEIYIF